MGLFDEIFGGGQQAAKDAGAQKIQGLRNAQQAFNPYYETSRGDISSGYKQAQDIFQPAYGIGLEGAQAYADITGAAGTAGQDRARALFQTDPGYEFARDEALRAVERTQGTGGFQGSGNVMAALQDRASGLAAKQYGDYVNRLQPFLNYNALTQGQLGGAYTGEGKALSDIALKGGDVAYGTEAGVGSAQAAATLGAAKAKSDQIGQAVKLGSQLLGFAFPGGLGLPGGGTLLGSLGFGGAGGGGAAGSQFAFNGAGVDPSLVSFV